MIIQDDFGVCSDVPAILHFGDTVAVFILTKNVLLLFVRKIHEVTPMHFWTSLHSSFHTYLLNSLYAEKTGAGNL